MKPMSDSAEVPLEYAWGWFSYHAGQRFASFNFFAVFAGAIAAGYLTTLERNWPWVGAVIAAFGFLISVGFALLDVRNRELVECSRQALLKLEKARGLSILADSRSRKYLSNKTKFGLALLPVRLQSGLTKHGLIFQGIQYFAATAFLVGFAYAVCGFTW